MSEPETVQIQVSTELLGLAGKTAAKHSQYENTTDFIEEAIEFYITGYKALENDQVAFSVKMPTRLWEALTWYAERTQYWISRDHAEESYNKMIVGFIEDCMEAEAETPHLGLRWLKHVLGDEYELHPSIPMN